MTFDKLVIAKGIIARPEDDFDGYISGNDRYYPYGAVEKAIKHYSEKMKNSYKRPELDDIKGVIDIIDFNYDTGEVTMIMKKIDENKTTEFNMPESKVDFTVSKSKTIDGNELKDGKIIFGYKGSKNEIKKGY